MINQVNHGKKIGYSRKDFGAVGDVRDLTILLNEYDETIKHARNELNQQGRYNYPLFCCDLETTTNTPRPQIISLQQGATKTGRSSFYTTCPVRVRRWFDYYTFSDDPSQLVATGIGDLFAKGYGKAWVFFHNGKNFDFSYLEAIFSNRQYLEVLKSAGVTVEAIRSTNWAEIHLYKKSGKRVQHLFIRDSLFFIKGSIKEFGKEWEINKLDTIETLKPWYLTGTVDLTALYYCMLDVQILALKLRQNMETWATSDIPTTVSSQARKKILQILNIPNFASLFENRFISDDEAGQIYQNIDLINRKFRRDKMAEMAEFDGFRGGLSVVNPFYTCQLINGKIFIGDVVSQYPHKTTWPLPVMSSVKGTDNIEDIRNLDPKNYFAHFTYYEIKTKKPVKHPPYILRAHTEQKNSIEELNAYIYQANRFDCYESGYTVQQIEALHKWKRKEFKGAYYGTETTTQLGQYAWYNFNLKSEAKEHRDAKGATPDEVSRWALAYSNAKLDLNSGGFGSFCMRYEAPTMIFSLEFNENQGSKEGYFFNRVTEPIESDARNLLGASLITSGARGYLLAESLKLQKLGYTVLAHDTDSNFFTKFNNDDLSPEYFTSSQLGGWEVSEKDGIFSWGYFLAPKRYVLGSRNGEVTGNLEDFDQGEKSLLLDKCGSAGIPKETFKEEWRKIFTGEPFKVKAKTLTPTGYLIEEKEKFILSPEFIEYYTNGKHTHDHNANKKPCY